MIKIRDQWWTCVCTSATVLDDLPVCTVPQGLLLSMYYIIVALSIVLVIIMILSPSLRPWAATFFVVFWSSAWWPIKLRQWDAFCNSWLFTLWREYFYYEYLIEEPLSKDKRYLFAEMPHGKPDPAGCVSSASSIPDSHYLHAWDGGVIRVGA